jgi:hypothetical protein
VDQLPGMPPRTHKRCSGCDRVLPLADFNRNRRKADGRQSYCRDCFSQWHQRNKAVHNAQIHARNKRVAKDLQDRLLAYLRKHPCVDCGEEDLVVLEFDHLRDKTHNVAYLIRCGSWPRVLEEIAKCEVVCANCHRRRTARRGRFYRFLATFDDEDEDP